MTMLERMPSILKTPQQIETPTITGSSSQMTLSVFVVVVAALYFGRDVLMPLTLAVLLSILLAPLVGLLRRIGLGRVPSVLLSVIFAVGIIFAIGGLIGTQLVDLASNVPTYAHTIEQKANTIRAYGLKQLGHVAKSLGANGHASAGQPAAPPRQLMPNIGAKDGQAPIPVEVHQPTPSPLELAKIYLSPVLSPMGTVGIVFVVAIFILLQQEDLRDRLIRLFGSHDLRRTTVALDDGGRRLSRYFLTQLGINTAFGVIIGVGLSLIGVPSPLLWGVLSGLLRFVPYVGSFISALFPLALAAAVDPGWSMAAWTAGLFIIVEPIMGQAIEPMVYGHSTGLSPVSVVVAAIFWSWLWGPVGLILSTPLTLCLVVLGRHVDRLEFLDILLGDRPALTPVESFYQRMLAGDQDEARDQAESLLKERSLTSYYDDVALKGLQLAAADAQRGMLNPQQLERVRDTIKDVIEAISDHGDKVPPVKAEGSDSGEISPPSSEPAKTSPPSSFDTGEEQVLPIWKTPSPVLCLAGRGPLDEAATSMLSHLLASHGLGSRLESYDAASRSKIGMLDREGVAMVCVSYLDTEGKQAQLRYLIQRLRAHMPGILILVGLWPIEHPVLQDRRLREELGADIYTSTLAEAVQLCVSAARTPPRSGTSEAISAFKSERLAS